MWVQRSILTLVVGLSGFVFWGASCGVKPTPGQDGGNITILNGEKSTAGTEPTQAGPEANSEPEASFVREVPQGQEPSQGPESSTGQEPSQGAETGPEPTVQPDEPSTPLQDASPGREESTQPEPPPVDNATPPRQSWIGEPCSRNSDCNFTGGRCQTTQSGYPQGHCTQDCTRTCPDKSGKPVTFCIKDASGKGHCVSQCNTALFPQNGCRSGYSCRSQSRFNDTNTRKDVCIPYVASQDKGTYVARMYITYYYLSEETNYSGSANTTLYDSQCKALVKVPAKYADSVCIEGSGRLKDGRIINYAKRCSCGRRCPTGGIVCYSILNKSKYPWGAGAAGRSLRPLRSLAVDRSIIPIGTRLYIPEWDGVTLPTVSGIGGFKHDGCFVADDVGGAIKGNHFDFFSGTSSMWKALEKIHSTRKYLTVYKNPGRCP